MPIIRTTNNYPYPVADSFSGIGLRTAYFNEVTDSVLNEQINGHILAAGGTRRGGQTAGRVFPVLGSSFGGGLTGTIGVNHVGEILPGFNQLLIRVATSLYYTTSTIVISGIPATVTGVGPLNFIFTLTNNVTGQSAVVARFFLNEQILSNLLATFGLPALTHPLGYSTNVPEGYSVTTFIVPMPPALVTSQANHSDYCTLNISLNSPIATSWGISSSPMLHHFEVLQIKNCAI